MRHLVDTSTIAHSVARAILDRAKEIQQLPNQQTETLKGRTVVLSFFEDTTRTKSSFELAVRRTGADVLPFDVTRSSLSKGETLEDTINVVCQPGVDALVMRHPNSGASRFVASFARVAIINAGDGRFHHPTQAFADSLTLENELGSLGGVNVLIVGDVLHSRVARSNMCLLPLLGANVGVLAPGTLGVPQAAFNARVFDTKSEAVQWADVIMLLRLQRERMERGLVPSLGEYRRYYGIGASDLANEKKLLMHPGPVNYGVEIDHDVANSAQSLIAKQVSNGLAVRMSILEYCILE